MMFPDRLMGPTATSFLFLMCGLTVAAPAQGPATPPKMIPQKESMKRMPAMSGMMEGPHHVLAMAYRENLITFAQALHGEVAHATTVNMDVATPAVAEMRRSFDQMTEHHKAQMGTMSAPPTASMSAMMTQMETHLTALGAHLTELEAEVKAATPDPKKVSEHTAEILKHGAEMSAMHAKAKPATPME